MKQQLDKARAKTGDEENSRNPDKAYRASAIMEAIPNVGRLWQSPTFAEANNSKAKIGIGKQ